MKQILLVIIIIGVMIFGYGGACGKSGSDSGSSGTVYITNSGSKYHRSGCQYLSGGAIAISRQDAINQGYTACSVCKP